jgi:hypothetical protein
MKRLFIVLAVLSLTGCGVQPTDPIRGAPATGAMIYLVQINAPVPVLRPTRNQVRGDEVLRLLADGPTAAERDQGFTTEVPPAAAPMKIEGSTVTLPVDPNSLSLTGAQQIACTAPVPGPVTLVGGGQSRGPITCPA